MKINNSNIKVYNDKDGNTYIGKPVRRLLKDLFTYTRVLEDFVIVPTSSIIPEKEFIFVRMGGTFEQSIDYIKDEKDASAEDKQANLEKYIGMIYLYAADRKAFKNIHGDDAELTKVFNVTPGRITIDLGLEYARLLPQYKAIN